MGEPSPGELLEMARDNLKAMRKKQRIQGTPVGFRLEQTIPLNKQPDIVIMASSKTPKLTVEAFKSIKKEVLKEFD